MAQTSALIALIRPFLTKFRTIMKWSQIRMKAVGNSRENTLNISVTVFLIWERKRERKSRSGKRNQLHGISKAKHFDGKYAGNFR